MPGVAGTAQRQVIAGRLRTSARSSSRATKTTAPAIGNSCSSEKIDHHLSLCEWQFIIIRIVRKVRFLTHSRRRVDHPLSAKSRRAVSTPNSRWAGRRRQGLIDRNSLYRSLMRQTIWSAMTHRGLCDRRFRQRAWQIAVITMVRAVGIEPTLLTEPDFVSAASAKRNARRWWCPRSDSNEHSLQNSILSGTRLSYPFDITSGFFEQGKTV